MKTFPILYSRTSTGATQQWQIFVEGDSYYTKTGQIGGTVVTHSPIKCVGKNLNKKNSTTNEEQAVAEAQAKFDKQCKTGYFEDITKIDEMPYVECMLAKHFNDRKDKVKYPVGVQIKFNGVRCIATRFGLFSRKGEKWISVPHIKNSLDSFFEQYPDAVLDGELFNEDLREKLNELISLVRKKKPTLTELAESEKVVRYYIYDMYDATVGQETHYLLRGGEIPKLLKGNPYYFEVKTKICNNESEVLDVYNDIISTGHEGAIVRDLNMPYENKRSSGLLKIKPEDSDEMTILDVQEGSGNWLGKAKIITVKTDSGLVFDATFKGNMEQATKFLNDKDKWIGKRVTIKYNGITGKGSGCPQYAQLDINNCLRAEKKL